MGTILTPEEEASLIAVREEWRLVGLSTQPADPDAAERGIQETYRALGRPSPRAIVWCDSPAAACAAAALLRIPHIAQPSLRVPMPGWQETFACLADAAAELVRDRVLVGLEPACRDAIRFGMSEERMSPSMALLRERPTHPVYGYLPEELEDRLWQEVAQPLHDQFTHRTQEEFWRRPIVRSDRGGIGPGPSDLWGAAWGMLGGDLEAGVRDRLGARIRDCAWMSSWGMVQSALERQMSVACHGQFDISWLAFCDAAERFGGCLPGTHSGLSLAARSCGWWWDCGDVAAACEHPIRLELDHEGNLHSDVAMTVEYPDGWGLWRIHGVQVSEQIVLHPHTFTAREILREPNQEVRRILLERFGYDRLLEELHSQPMDTDDCGTLYRVNLPGERPLVIVRVINSTPETDGSFREYFLRVPPSMTTAREAVASTFGLPPSEFRPRGQS